ncbi:hypothetical protein Ancab_017522 [Ancistrocladus abbreviatus]
MRALLFVQKQPTSRFGDEPVTLLLSLSCFLLLEHLVMFRSPDLCHLYADDLQNAVSIVNENRLCNGASIFTASGAAVRKFQSEIEAGRAKLEFSFMYTRIKTVTQKWDDLPFADEAAPAMLTSSESQTAPDGQTCPFGE